MGDTAPSSSTAKAPANVTAAATNRRSPRPLLPAAVAPAMQAAWRGEEAAWLRNPEPWDPRAHAATGLQKDSPGARQLQQLRTLMRHRHAETLLLQDNPTYQAFHKECEEEASRRKVAKRGGDCERGAEPEGQSYLPSRPFRIVGRFDPGLNMLTCRPTLHQHDSLPTRGEPRSQGPRGSQEGKHEAHEQQKPCSSDRTGAQKKEEVKLAARVSRAQEIGEDAFPMLYVHLASQRVRCVKAGAGCADVDSHLSGGCAPLVLPPIEPKTAAPAIAPAHASAWPLRGAEQSRAASACAAGRSEGTGDGSTRKRSLAATQSTPAPPVPGQPPHCASAASALERKPKRRISDSSVEEELLPPLATCDSPVMQWRHGFAAARTALHEQLETALTVREAAARRARSTEPIRAGASQMLLAQCGRASVEPPGSSLWEHAAKGAERRQAQAEEALRVLAKESRGRAGTNPCDHMSGVAASLLKDLAAFVRTLPGRDAFDGVIYGEVQKILSGGCSSKADLLQQLCTRMAAFCCRSSRMNHVHVVPILRFLQSGSGLHMTELNVLLDQLRPMLGIPKTPPQLPARVLESPPLLPRRSRASQESGQELSRRSSGRLLPWEHPVPVLARLSSSVRRSLSGHARSDEDGSSSSRRHLKGVAGKAALQRDSSSLADGHGRLAATEISLASSAAADDRRSSERPQPVVEGDERLNSSSAQGRRSGDLTARLRSRMSPLASPSKDGVPVMQQLRAAADQWPEDDDLQTSEASPQLWLLDHEVFLKLLSKRKEQLIHKEERSRANESIVKEGFEAQTY